MASTATARNAKIDATMKAAADAGDVPGVVAMATDAKGDDLRGRASASACWASRPTMTPDTVVLDRLDDQGGHRRRRHAARRAGQARRSMRRRQGR